MAPAAVMPYNNHRDIPELLVITSSAEINGSLFTDAIVQKDCSVHVRGSVTGSLTIEFGCGRPCRRFSIWKNHQSRRPARRQPQRIDGMCLSEKGHRKVTLAPP